MPSFYHILSIPAIQLTHFPTCGAIVPLVKPYPGRVCPISLQPQLGTSYRLGLDVLRKATVVIQLANAK